MSDVKEHDVSAEAWDGRREPYRIESPAKLFVRPDGTTHRILDSDGIVHCVPAPGHMGCVLRWKPLDSSNPVQF